MERVLYSRNVGRLFFVKEVQQADPENTCVCRVQWHLWQKQEFLDNLTQYVGLWELFIFFSLWMNEYPASQGPPRIHSGCCFHSDSQLVQHSRSAWQKTQKSVWRFQCRWCKARGHCVEAEKCSVGTDSQDGMESIRVTNTVLATCWLCWMKWKKTSLYSERKQKGKCWWDLRRW